MESENKGHSIELLLSDASKQQLREKLAEVETGPWNHDSFRPHLSLAVIRQPIEQVQELRSVVRQFAARRSPFTIQLSSMGIFPGKRPVLTLMPAWHLELLQVHHHLMEHLDQIEVAPIPYYLPHQWSPHVTLMMGRPRREVSEVMERLSRIWWPGAYELDEVELVEFHPAVRLEKELLKGL